MRKPTISHVEQEIIETIAENFGITTIEATEKFLKQKRSMMLEAYHRGDVKIAEEMKKQLGE